MCVEKYFRDLFQTKPGARVSSAMRTEGLDRTTKDSIILIACFAHKNMRGPRFLLLFCANIGSTGHRSPLIRKPSI